MDLDSYLFHYMHYSWHSIYREFLWFSYHISCKSIIYQSRASLLYSALCNKLFL